MDISRVTSGGMIMPPKPMPETTDVPPENRSSFNVRARTEKGGL